MKAITLTEWLYFHLWKKDGPEEKNLHPKGVLIPETIFYKCGAPQQWFFTSKNGKILKKGIDHMNLEGIKGCFRKTAGGNKPVGLVFDAFPPTVSCSAKREMDNQLKQKALKRRIQTDSSKSNQDPTKFNPYNDMDLNDIHQEATEKEHFKEAAAGGLLRGWGETALGYSIAFDSKKNRDPMFISKQFVNEKAMIMANAKSELEKLALRHDNSENNEVYFRLGLKHFTKQQLSNSMSYSS